MERISPLDLEKSEFRATFRGYDRQAVREVLNKAAKEIETLRAELKQAREESEANRREVERFHAQETALKEALLLAQKTADETRSAAHREAELIVSEAHRKASDVQKSAQERINDLRWELERLSLERSKFYAKFRSLLEEHLSALGGASGLQPALVNLEVNDAVAG